MDARFGIFCRARGNDKAQADAWTRKDLSSDERQNHDEKFLRSRDGKEIRGRYWQVDRTGYLDADEEEDDPRDEVELLQVCLRRTELEICGAPDSKLLKRLHDQYSDQLREAHKKRIQSRICQKRKMKAEASKSRLLRLCKKMFADIEGSQAIGGSTE
ncbi:hypothetical protein DVH05_016412 [Phytophthora capsici]|nr:hypothetical protein DVH05_016412 [Phytophthora capsici]